MRGERGDLWGGGNGLRGGGGAWRGVRTLYWRAGEGREDMRGKGIERLIVGGRVWTNSRGEGMGKAGEGGGSLGLQSIVYYRKMCVIFCQRRDMGKG